MNGLVLLCSVSVIILSLSSSCTASVTRRLPVVEAGRPSARAGAKFGAIRLNESASSE